MRPTNRSALTLIELVLATGLLAVGMLSLTSMVLTSQTAQRSSTERTLARQSLHAKVAELRALLRQSNPPQFSSVLALDGATEDVEVVADDSVANRPKGTLLVETFNSAGALDEGAANAVLATFGLTAVDFNADGTTNETAVPDSELRVIPVLVRITWQTGTWRPGTPDAANAASAGQDAEMAMVALLY